MSISHNRSDPGADERMKYVLIIDEEVRRKDQDGAAPRMIWSDKTSLSVDRNQFQGSEIHQVMIKLTLRIKLEEDLSFV